MYFRELLGHTLWNWDQNIGHHGRLLQQMTGILGHMSNCKAYLIHPGTKKKRKTHAKMCTDYYSKKVWFDTRPLFSHLLRPTIYEPLEPALTGPNNLNILSHLMVLLRSHRWSDMARGKGSWHHPTKTDKKKKKRERKGRRKEKQK